MMYKDKAKQKEANRLASQRRRARQGMTPAGYDGQGMTHSVAECQERARLKLPWRPGDPVWPYTRHLTPMDMVVWCKVNKPSWITSAKPGDEDYNRDESAVREAI